MVLTILLMMVDMLRTKGKGPCVLILKLYIENSSGK